MTNERKLTKAELAKREDIIKDMKKNKRELVKRYGKDAEKVMYGRATNLAKKQAESMDNAKLREMIKTALMGPMKEDQVEEGNAFVVAADAARDAGKKEFEFPKGSGKMHPVTVKADIDELDATEKAASDKIGRGEEFTDDDAAAVADEMPKIGKDKEFKLMGEEDLDEGLKDKLKGALYGIAGTLGVQKYGMDVFNKVTGAIANALPAEKAYEFSAYIQDIVDLVANTADKIPMEEDLDLGHQDNEPHMLKADLYRIGKYAMELYQMVDQFEKGSEEVDFPHWWQAKVIKAKDMLVSAKHYLDFEVKEPQIDAMVDVAQEEDVIDENSAFQKRLAKLAADEKAKRDENPGYAAAGKELGKVDFEDFFKKGQSYGEFKKRLDKLEEGTWSLGTAKQIVSAINSLEMLQGMDAASIADSLEDDHKFYYNVIGDDLFHDALDRAEKSAAMGDMDRAQNGLFDAVARAEELLAVVRKRESSQPYSTDIFEEEISESFQDLVDKLMDQGKSETAAKKIAGAVNATYKQKYRK